MWSHPFVNLRMSPEVIASASLFHKENIIDPVLSATLHFLTILPSLVLTWVPVQYMHDYGTHTNCYPPLSITINIQWTFFSPCFKSSIGVILSSNDAISITKLH